MSESVTLTLDTATRQRLDSLVEVFRAEFAALGMGETTRVAVLREALTQGLTLLERQVRAGIKPLATGAFSDKPGQSETSRTESVADRIVRCTEGLWFCVWVERDSATGWYRVIASPFRPAESGGLNTLEDTMPDGAWVWDTHEPLSAAAARVIFEEWIHCLEKTVGDPGVKTGGGA